MAGTMGCSLLFVIILHISTVSGVIEISFEKGVPRLNNSLYCDYYFACHTEGETLQWRVGNNVFNYSGQSTIESVSDGSVSNCNYTATLLSLKPLLSSLSFKSALILTCQSNFNMPIICSDGSLLKMISIPEKELSLMAETTNNLVYLEHVLSQNLVNADNSTCTNVFVCGVNNDFMDVQFGNTTFLFTEFDFIGREHNEIQGTSVQQAILIDKEPYSLVVAMFIVGSEVMNVTCGFPQNIIFLSSMQCHPVTTMPETTGTMESESITMESESSTVGESSTMASEGGNNLPLILGPSITFGVLFFFTVAVIIPTIVCCKCCKTRSKRNKPEPTSELTTLTSRNERPTQPKPETRKEVEPESRGDEAETGGELHLEKIKVSDVSYNEVTYLAMNRGTYKPQLKLEDGDEIATLNPKQGVVISNSHKGYYPMKAKKHGVCLIISDCPAEPGTKRDEHNLIETWCYLGYHIEVRREVKYKELGETLKNIDNLLDDINMKYYESKFEMDSFICFILSKHKKGESGTIYDNIETTDIELILDNSEILRGKPKIFFIGFSIMKHGNCCSNTRKSADTFISYAASDGQQSYRDYKKGSVYVQVVCRTLCEVAKHRNLQELQELIKEDVPNMFAESHLYYNEIYQNPRENDYLKKKVHFFF